MRIRIHNPIYGVPTGILDKIGKIYIINNEVIRGGGVRLMKCLSNPKDTMIKGMRRYARILICMVTPSTVVTANGIR